MCHREQRSAKCEETRTVTQYIKENSAQVTQKACCLQYRRQALLFCLALFAAANTDLMLLYKKDHEAYKEELSADLQNYAGIQPVKDIQIN